MALGGSCGQPIPPFRFLWTTHGSMLHPHQQHAALCVFWLHFWSFLYHPLLRGTLNSPITPPPPPSCAWQVSLQPYCCPVLHAAVNIHAIFHGFADAGTECALSKTKKLKSATFVDNVTWRAKWSFQTFKASRSGEVWSVGFGEHISSSIACKLAALRVWLHLNLWYMAWNVSSWNSMGVGTPIMCTVWHFRQSMRRVDEPNGWSITHNSPSSNYCIYCRGWLICHSQSSLFKLLYLVSRLADPVTHNSPSSNRDMYCCRWLIYHLQSSPFKLCRLLLRLADVSFTILPVQLCCVLLRSVECNTCTRAVCCDS